MWEITILSIQAKSSLSWAVLWVPFPADMKKFSKSKVKIEKCPFESEQMKLIRSSPIPLVYALSMNCLLSGAKSSQWGCTGCVWTYSMLCSNLPPFSTHHQWHEDLLTFIPGGPLLICFSYQLLPTFWTTWIHHHHLQPFIESLLCARRFIRYLMYIILFI